MLRNPDDTSGLLRSGFNAGQAIFIEFSFINSLISIVCSMVNAKLM